MSRLLSSLSQRPLVVTDGALLLCDNPDQDSWCSDWYDQAVRSHVPSPLGARGTVLSSATAWVFFWGSESVWQFWLKPALPRIQTWNLSHRWAQFVSSMRGRKELILQRTVCARVCVCVSADLTVLREKYHRGERWLASLLVSGFHGYRSSALITHPNPWRPRPFLYRSLSPFCPLLLCLFWSLPRFWLSLQYSVALSEFLTPALLQTFTPLPHSASFLLWQPFFPPLTFCPHKPTCNLLRGRCLTRAQHTAKVKRVGFCNLSISIRTKTASLWLPHSVRRSPISHSLYLFSHWPCHFSFLPPIPLQLRHSVLPLQLWRSLKSWDTSHRGSLCNSTWPAQATSANRRKGAVDVSVYECAGEREGNQHHSCDSSSANVHYLSHTAS